MTNFDIVRSWKDEDYLLNLSSREQAVLPDNPAGLTELGDEDLIDVDGGSTPICLCAAASLAACTPVVQSAFMVSAVIGAATAAYTTSGR